MSGEIVVEKAPRRGFVFRLLANTAAIWLTGYFLSGVHVSGPLGAIVAGLVLTVVNALIRPLLVIVTLPLTVLTFGLFMLVVNGLSLLLAAWISAGAFDIDGLGSAILAWILIWLVNWALTALFRKETVRVIDR